MKVSVLHLSLCVFYRLALSDAKKEVFMRITPSRSQFFQYDDVSLSCEVSAGHGRMKRNGTSRKTESCPYSWGTLIGSTCTISALYPSDTGFYWCESSSGEQSQTVHISVTAALRVLPNRSQFFQYESVSLSCGQQGNSPDWRLKKNTSRHKNKECSTFRDGKYKSRFFIEALYPSDTGVYWCESAAGGCSNAANITVTGGSVILESPVHPVMEGDAVTLRCTNRGTSSSSLTADFYKDGLLISSSSVGIMTIHSVSASDEGLYMCNVSGAGRSPDSWLAVRVSDSAAPEAPVMSLSRLIYLGVVASPYLLSTIILGLIYKDNRRGENCICARSAPHRVAEDRNHDVIMELD
ncbi:Fc receptor-like protein 5 [Chaetodon auriga]|uniref:Fc receptor-like protein 5 n=1 Tax=Chaetodon auriga TaxID=39042 RepID=UPI004033066D